MSREHISIPDPDEMEMFGFDPNNEKDVFEFTRIIEDSSDSGTASPDYSRDAFEFGGQPLPRQLGETVVKSELQTNSGE